LVFLRAELACRGQAYMCALIWMYGIQSLLLFMCRAYSCISALPPAQVYLEEKPVAVTDLWNQDEAAVVVLSRSMG
jgi:hypothetical protein